MWLHEHRINRERQARGELPVSGLWLWGATPPAAPDPPARSPPTAPLPRSARLFGEDAYVEALWRLRGSSTAPLPDGFAQSPLPTGAARVVLYPTVGAEGPLRAFEQLEQRWLAPALQALRTRRLSSFDICWPARSRIGSARWRLARFWRPRSPWWQTLA